ncbi:MAG: restriction endonuclease subunit S [Verrucomicrobiales bacterium]|nr:restriction endonuclease subunit S [Verrucomicrobiales bacterium]
MKDWKVKRLGEIAEMCLGKMLDKEKNRGDYRPYLANFNVRWGGFDLSALNKMRFEDHEDERYGLKDGDLIICEGGEPGRCAIWRNQVPGMKIQKALHRVRVRSGYNSEYLYYRMLLAGRIGELDRHFIGSTIKHLTGKGLGDVEFAFPDEAYQEKIIRILSSIDEKIDINNQINAELEQLAKLIYDYWFVQFDFPISAELASKLGNKKLEGKPYRQSGGPMAYNDALKKEIPEGWATSDLGTSVNQIIDHRGKTPTKLDGDWSSNPEDIIALSAKVVKGGKLIGLQNANRVSRDLYEKWMPTKLEEGDILMTSEAPAGEFFLIYGKTEFCLSQRLFGIRADKAKVQPSYLYHELSHGYGYHNIMGSLSGSTVFGIRQDNLRAVNILVPDQSVQTSFEEIAVPLYKQIRTLESQNSELSSLRDWLLPMLMNGQVTVTD